MLVCHVPQGFLNGVHRGAEEVGAKLLEAGTGDVGVEIDSLEERVDFDRCLRRGREGSLCTLASSAETTESTRAEAVVEDDALNNYFGCYDQVSDDLPYSKVCMLNCFLFGGFRQASIIPRSARLKWSAARATASRYGHLRMQRPI
ncbi:hypothetical protein PRIPAC_78451 [Pristionchus pacificus]|uniref:Uncharacterized protein n=1 Tax=Pristionchus pacificus TaxID=54126 RepID=A0A2A6CPL5_PRIPA|nr:hypothetical protein PRIPAC_78451 [Pristionchus pacificus]|eukprot:PDM80046.1 hypothetical protein PRIPAC_32625 [Pristionchus pacificus]